MSEVIPSHAEKNAELVAAFERWLVVKHYSSSIQYSYLRTVRGFAAFLGPKSLGAAEHTDVRAFLTHDAHTPAMSNRLRIGLNALYRFLTFAGVVRRSPLWKVQRRKQPPRRLPRCLTEAEVAQLIASANSRRDRAIVEMFYASGLRLSELARLRFEDIDLKRRTIRVIAGKGNKDRIALLGSKAVEALRAYFDERERAGVFGLSPRGISLVIRDMGKRAGLGRVTPHMLRHSFATALLNNGADIRYVQELLGHAQISSTQIYTHLAIADLKRIHEHHHPHAKREADAEG